MVWFLAAMLVITLWQRFPYHVWRYLHKLLAVVYLVLAFLLWCWCLPPGGRSLQSALCGLAGGRAVRSAFAGRAHVAAIHRTRVVDVPGAPQWRGRAGMRRVRRAPGSTRPERFAH